MLNPFPELLFLSPLAPTILRVAVGLFFLNLAYLSSGSNSTFAEYFRRKRMGGAAVSWLLSIATLAIAASLIAGFYTQVSAIAGMAEIVILALIKKSSKGMPIYGWSFLILSFFTLASLLFSGAGAFAFDLPL